MSIVKRQRLTLILHPTTKMSADEEKLVDQIFRRAIVPDTISEGEVTKSTLASFHSVVSSEKKLIDKIYAPSKHGTPMEGVYGLPVVSTDEDIIKLRQDVYGVRDELFKDDTLPNLATKGTTDLWPWSDFIHQTASAIEFLRLERAINPSVVAELKDDAVEIRNSLKLNEEKIREAVETLQAGIETVLGIRLETEAPLEEGKLASIDSPQTELDRAKTSNMALRIEIAKLKEQKDMQEKKIERMKEQFQTVTDSYGTMLYNLSKTTEDVQSSLVTEGLTIFGLGESYDYLKELTLIDEDGEYPDGSKPIDISTVNPIISTKFVLFREEGTAQEWVRDHFTGTLEAGDSLQNYNTFFADEATLLNALAHERKNIIDSCRIQQQTEEEKCDEDKLSTREQIIQPSRKTLRDFITRSLIDSRHIFRDAEFRLNDYLASYVPPKYPEPSIPAKPEPLADDASLPDVAKKAVEVMDYAVDFVNALSSILEVSIDELSKSKGELFTFYRKYLFALDGEMVEPFKRYARMYPEEKTLVPVMGKDDLLPSESKSRPRTSYLAEELWRYTNTAMKDITDYVERTQAFAQQTQTRLRDVIYTNRDSLLLPIKSQFYAGNVREESKQEKREKQLESLGYDATQMEMFQKGKDVSSEIAKFEEDTLEDHPDNWSYDEFTTFLSLVKRSTELKDLATQDVNGIIDFMIRWNQAFVKQLLDWKNRVNSPDNRFSALQGKFDRLLGSSKQGFKRVVFVASIETPDQLSTFEYVVQQYAGITDALNQTVDDLNEQVAITDIRLTGFREYLIAHVSPTTERLQDFDNVLPKGEVAEYKKAVNSYVGTLHPRITDALDVMKVVVNTYKSANDSLESAILRGFVSDLETIRSRFSQLAVDIAITASTLEIDGYQIPRAMPLLEGTGKPTPIFQPTIDVLRNIANIAFQYGTLGSSKSISSFVGGSGSMRDASEKALNPVIDIMSNLITAFSTLKFVLVDMVPMSAITGFERLEESLRAKAKDFDVLWNRITEYQTKAQDKISTFIGEEFQLTGLESLTSETGVDVTAVVNQDVRALSDAIFNYEWNNVLITLADSIVDMAEDESVPSIAIYSMGNDWNQTFTRLIEERQDLPDRIMETLNQVNESLRTAKDKRHLEDSSFEPPPHNLDIYAYNVQTSSAEMNGRVFAIINRYIDGFEVHFPELIPTKCRLGALKILIGQSAERLSSSEWETLATEASKYDVGQIGAMFLERQLENIYKPIFEYVSNTIAPDERITPIITHWIASVIELDWRKGFISLRTNYFFYPLECKGDEVLDNLADEVFQFNQHLLAASKGRGFYYENADLNRDGLRQQELTVQRIGESKSYTQKADEWATLAAPFKIDLSEQYGLMWTREADAAVLVIIVGGGILKRFPPEKSPFDNLDERTVEIYEFLEKNSDNLYADEEVNKTFRTYFKFIEVEIGEGKEMWMHLFFALYDIGRVLEPLYEFVKKIDIHKKQKSRKKGPWIEEVEEEMDVVKGWTRPDGRPGSAEEGSSATTPMTVGTSMKQIETNLGEEETQENEEEESEEEEAEESEEERVSSLGFL